MACPSSISTRFSSPPWVGAAPLAHPSGAFRGFAGHASRPSAGHHRPGVGGVLRPPAGRKSITFPGGRGGLRASKMLTIASATTKATAIPLGPPRKTPSWRSDAPTQSRMRSAHSRMRSRSFIFMSYLRPDASSDRRRTSSFQSIYPPSTRHPEGAVFGYLARVIWAGPRGCSDFCKLFQYFVSYFNIW